MDVVIGDAMKVEILSIGDELLIGQIVNTNAAYIAEKLTEIGHQIEWITVVGDNEDQIREALKLAESRADVVVATGGLGPTHDDITKKVFAEYFNSNLILNEAILAAIRERFRRRRVRMAKINELQAMVPDNAVIIENRAGTAPGLLFQRDNRYFFVMPGVPAEMMAMMESFIIPFLKDKKTVKFKKLVIHTTGIAESTIFERLGDISKLEQLVRIAFLPSYGGVNIRLIARGSNEDEIQQRIDRVRAVFDQKFHDYIWGYDNDTFEQVVARLLIQHNKTIAIGEMGTHGYLTDLMAGLPTADQFFLAGVTLTSLRGMAKFVGETDLNAKEHGISLETSQKLTQQVRQRFGSDLAIGIVHESDLDITTYITLCDHDYMASHRFVFNFHPAMNVQRIAAASLRLLYQHLTSQKTS